MKIKEIKKIVSSVNKNNVINRETLNVHEAVFTKKEATDDMKEMYEFVYELIDDNILLDKKMPLSKREKFEKIRNRMGILKECEIKIN